MLGHLSMDSHLPRPVLCPAFPTSRLSLSIVQQHCAALGCGETIGPAWPGNTSVSRAVHLSGTEVAGIERMLCIIYPKDQLTT